MRLLISENPIGKYERKMSDRRRDTETDSGKGEGLGEMAHVQKSKMGDGKYSGCS